ncbi:MAG: PIN domain-containing protein [Bacteroidia bacterium]|nr:PIN domain-containing protein [Bacteroidia bacterium]
MTRYLLDTQATVYLLTGDKKLPQNIREMVEYQTYPFYVSIVSIMEIAQLMTIGKIKTYPIETIQSELIKYGITIVDMEIKQLESMRMLPIYSNHTDPFDRILIVTAILYKMTLISSDTKLPLYRKSKLILIEI